MKKFLFLIIALMGISITACDPKNDLPEEKKENPKGKILPDQLVRIEAADGVKLRSTEAQYTEDGELLPTALEVAKNGYVLAGMVFFQPDTSLIWAPAYNTYGERVFGPKMRDTISDKPALLMFSEDILSEKGLRPGFLKAYDMIVLDRKLDTIAYIPNKTLREAEQKIVKAYADSNYNEVYRLFKEEAYKFIPTTGKQYRKLKEKGLQ